MLATPALNDSMKNIREATPKVPIMLIFLSLNIVITEKKTDEIVNFN
jgi:hypothetical protein